MSNEATVSTSARLPSDVARDLARTSVEDDRSQNGQLIHLLRLGLAGRARLKQLEAFAIEEPCARLDSAAKGKR